MLGAVWHSAATCAIFRFLCTVRRGDFVNYELRVVICMSIFLFGGQRVISGRFNTNRTSANSGSTLNGNRKPGPGTSNYIRLYWTRARLRRNWISMSSLFWFYEWIATQIGHVRNRYEFWTNFIDSARHNSLKIFIYTNSIHNILHIAHFRSVSHGFSLWGQK